MTESKYTPDGLPVVTEDNLLALVEILEKRTQISLDFLTKLKNENPGLGDLLTEINKDYKENERDYVCGILGGAMLVYESLRRQAAVNRLEKEIKQL